MEKAATGGETRLSTTVATTVRTAEVQAKVLVRNTDVYSAQSISVVQIEDPIEDYVRAPVHHVAWSPRPTA